MPTVSFQARAGTVARSPYRTDVALFVGFVDRRRIETVRRGHPELLAWLDAEGWARKTDDVDELLDIPVPIDRFDTFDRLFAWDHRPVGGQGGARVADTYLGSAVRSFFAQGGRLCYVVRVGAPWPVPADAGDAAAERRQRDPRLERLIPGAQRGAPDASPVERKTWNGVWTLYGLPDVSFVALPDLPDVVAGEWLGEAPLPVPPRLPVEFLECSEPGGTSDDEWLHRLRAPTTDDPGYRAWARALAVVVGEVSRPRASGTLREVQVVAAVPRPQDELEIRDLLGYLEGLEDWGGRGCGLNHPVEAGGLASAFLQLAYPWLSTELSRRLPGAIEPPDAALTGALARGALERGCFRSAGGQRVRGVLAQAPALGGRDAGDPSDRRTLAGRVSLIGPTPAGVQVLSDVTTALDATFRLAHANRTIAAIVRVLRTVGEELAFAPSAEDTWSNVRARVRDVLREFWQAGALRGESEGDAFAVRCDRSTMTQDDLDSGRLVVIVEVSVAMAIQRISVVLTRVGDTVTLERAA